MDDFEAELKAGFLEEAAQLMVDTEQCFLALESSPHDPVILEKLFRLAHNLKGSAKAVGFNELGAFTHELESYLLKLKNGDIKTHAESVSLLLQCNDHILKMISALKADFNAQVDGTHLLEEIRRQIAGQTAEASPQSVAPPAPAEPVVAAQPEEAPVSVVETLPEPEVPAVEAVEAVAEPVAAVVAPVEPAAVAPVIELVPSAPQAQAPADESIRVSLGRLEKLINFVGEMVILETVLREQIQSSNTGLVRKTVHQLGKVTKEVQDISMSLRMVPLKQTFMKMQRIVRDTSGALGKKIQLNLQGEETELDKTILEHLGDPLVHLIRNAVDHGVEAPEARVAKGKPEQGNISLNAYHHSGSLIIEVRDDGGGLDPQKLKAKAVEKKILKPDAVLADKEAYQLIFHSGFSTKAQVTDVSGRGVGMDVVKTNIEKLQGDIQIESEVGKGTCFRIRLPLTLAIIDAMVVLCENERYVLPLSHMHESIKPQESDIHFISGVGEILCLRNENLPLYRLNQLLGKRSAKASESVSDYIAIVVRVGAEPFAILVDDILGQYQVVIKKLGDEHRNLKGFSGSSILGDGRPALILELTELVAKYRPVAQPAVNSIDKNAIPQRRAAA
ncbi:MAG: chemotaxis protein CheA [Oligoflexia bacterium]|nr:chemotaxis protein CheA [Oligoflexia bacterium]